jgi:MFS family permease
VPVTDPSRVPRAEEAAELRRAWRQHRAAGLWRLAATLATVAGLISITLGGGIAALWGPPLGVWFAIVAVAGLPLLVALWSRTRARKAGESAQAALDAAWLAAASSVLAGRSEDLSIQELGRVLGVDRLDSERWLAGLGASEQVVTRVDDAGDIVYRLQAPAAADAERATEVESALSEAQATEPERSSQ